jgi:hypothetical protein
LKRQITLSRRASRPRHRAVAALRRFGDPAERLCERLAQQGGVDAAEVHGELGQRQRSSGAVGRPSDEDRLQEVGTVLDPVQVDPEAWQEAWIPMASRDEPEEGADDLGGPRVDGRRPGSPGLHVIHVDDLVRRDSAGAPGAR